MAITVRGPRPVVNNPPAPAQIAKTPDNTELVKHLATQVIELGKMVQKLSEEKPEPIQVAPPKTDVVATIQRDADGRMESILITHRS